MAEKRDNRLATVLALALLAMILMLTGAPGLVNRNPPHDEASTAAIPYTLAGQDEYWRAEYRIEAADPAADDTVSVDFAYQAVFTLAYLGDEADLAEAGSYTVTFAPGTDYEASGKMSRDEPGGFEDTLTGRTPLWTLYYPADPSVAGAIPPMDGSYRVRIQVGGMAHGSTDLTLTREEAQP